EGKVRIATRKEGEDLFDNRSRQLMKMSGEEFVRRYDAGEFNSPKEDSRVIELEMLLPFVDKLRNGRRHSP
ncbi:MAG TPA: hypothetical protein VFJ58_27110, partial [Armatimonadota bacterium]|nr:hypothetical protein [Armatimonadota bacterium]